MNELIFEWAIPSSFSLSTVSIGPGKRDLCPEPHCGLPQDMPLTTGQEVHGNKRTYPYTPPSWWHSIYWNYGISCLNTSNPISGPAQASFPDLSLGWTMLQMCTSLGQGAAVWSREYKRLDLRHACKMSTGMHRGPLCGARQSQGWGQEVGIHFFWYRTVTLWILNSTNSLFEF